MRSLWRKLSAPFGGSTAHENDAESFVGRSSEFHLESLEPRLLLSADPISAEFARTIQDIDNSNNAGDVAAIVHQIDTLAETNGADSSGKDNGHSKVNWPDDWNISDSEESTQMDLLSVVFEMINKAHQSIDAGVDSTEIAISMKTDIQENSQSAAASPGSCG